MKELSHKLNLTKFCMSFMDNGQLQAMHKGIEVTNISLDM